jgi:hypothetical protein
VSTQQFQQPLTPLTGSMITVHNLEHPRSVTRQIKACLTLAGVAAAAVLAMTATSPAANADTVDLPEFPATSGAQIAPESLGVAPFFAGEAYEQNGSYTDLLGTDVDTSASYYLNGPLQIDDYEFPGSGPASLTAINETTPGIVASDSGAINGDVGGTAFSYVGAEPGYYNLYEDTPFVATGASDATQNINDVLLFDPTGNPLGGLSGVEFGIQYIDLPNAVTPVDAVNFLGSGGEVLYSLPVTGDLLTSLF